MCFENNPDVHEYEKLSSASSLLHQLGSQQSVDSNRMMSFQLTWRPTLTEGVIHLNTPKPLPPMPVGLPQSESLQQDLRYLTKTATLASPLLPAQNSEGELSEVSFSQDVSSDNGNVSEVYPPVRIEIPKLRGKKQPVANDGELLESEDEHVPELQEKLNRMNLDDRKNESSDSSLLKDVTKNLSGSTETTKESHSTPPQSAFTFSFSPSKAPQKAEQTSRFEDTIDAVLPPDRTPLTIIKDNHKSYSSFRARMASGNSDKYYDDVVLDSVRTNVDSAFSKGRDSIKRFSKIPEESLNEFTIGDYMESKVVTEEKSDDIQEPVSEEPAPFSDISLSSRPPESRVSLFGLPLGESTEDGDVIMEKTPEQQNLSSDHEQQDVSMETDDNLRKIDESLEKYKNQDFSIPPVEDSRVSSLGDSVFERSNDSAASNFTLKLMQMKREKEELVMEDEKVSGRSLAPARKWGEGTSPSTLKPKSVQLSPHVSLETTRQKLDEHDKPELIQQDSKQEQTQESKIEHQNTSTPSAATFNPKLDFLGEEIDFKPTSNEDEENNMGEKLKLTVEEEFRKTLAPPKKDLYPPQFPRSPTQDLLSLAEEVHNIWANLKKGQTTIRSKSMKLLPSMGLEIGKMLKNKEKLSRNNTKIAQKDSKEPDDGENHIRAELSKVPKPLLPEQHFGSLAAFSAEIEPEGEIFGNKKQNVGSTRTREREITKFHPPGPRYGRKLSGSYVSARELLGTRDYGNIRLPESQEMKIFERKVHAPKLHKVVTVGKRGQSLKGLIHEAEKVEEAARFEEAVDENPVNLPKDDQGRLYVRIVGLKLLDLPALEQHKAQFLLVLDNGIHCILTPPVELGANTSINQEFELTVSANLEFILTLKAEYEYEGVEKLVEITEKYPVRKRVLGGILGHKTVYKTRTRVATKIDYTDPWDSKMAQDGSFARSYVDFAQYEPLITGKACNFDVTCFNEWETYVEKGVLKKRQPYRIGKLELQMLYIPRTKESEVFPPSIHVAYEAVREYQLQLQVSYEGFLSQEGGDCNYLKRRWFTLNGTDLIAHNEFSKKTRAKINLIKAVGLVSSNTRGYGRRQDDSVMPQGFKVKFMNGETIEFVADSLYEKMNWLRALDKVILKNKFRQPWIRILYEQLE